MGLEVVSGIGEWGLGGRGQARGCRDAGRKRGGGECQHFTCLLPAPGGAPVSGPPASDPWAPAPAFSDPWGGSPAKPSTNGTAGTGGGLGGQTPGGPSLLGKLSAILTPAQWLGVLTRRLTSSLTSTACARPCRPLGAAQVSPHPACAGRPWHSPAGVQRRACVLCRDGRFGGKSCKGGAGRPLCSSPGAAGPVTVAGRPVSLGPFCGLRPRPHLPAGVPAQGGHAAAGLACAPHCWESLVLCPCPSNAHCLEAAGRGLVLQPLCSCFCAFFPT